jgi:hypothetical protein
MKSKTKYVAFAGLTSCALIALCASRPLHAASSCKSVTGTFSQTVTTTNCTSDVGLCAAGTATFKSTTFTTWFSALDTASSAGMPAHEAAVVASYDGDLTFTDPSGNTLTAVDVGVIAPNTLDTASPTSFTEVERSLAGTGKYANVSGVLFISGSLTDNQNVFTGALSGTICGW